MRRRRRKILWLILLLILAVGIFTRGRTNSAQRPASPIQAAPVSEKPAAGRPEIPAQPSTPVALHEPFKTRVSGSRNERQLRLRIVGVHDGDTITGLDESKTRYKIRLDAIDAPELGQPHGQASKKALSGKVFGKDVIVTVKTRDKYGRTVGHVLIDGRDMNLEMLEEGMAWHYEKYDRNKRLAEAERAARVGRLGLWSDGRDAIAPWEWRSAKRNKH